MTTKLTRTHDHERRETLWQIAQLDVMRHLTRAGASHLDSAYVWSQLGDVCAERADRHASMAVQDGESFAEVGRVLGMSRQAVSKRYRHLQAVN